MLNIKDLSKEIDGTAVRGGIANASTQMPYQANFSETRNVVVGNSGSVAIDNGTSQTNDAYLPSFQVGNLIAVLGE